MDESADETGGDTSGKDSPTYEELYGLRIATLLVIYLLAGIFVINLFDRFLGIWWVSVLVGAVLMAVALKIFPFLVPPPDRVTDRRSQP